MIELCCEYLCVLCIHLTLCYYHVTHKSLSESRYTLWCAWILRSFWEYQSSIIWQVWLRVFVYQLNGYSFEYGCCHVKLQIWRLLRVRSSLTFRQKIERRFTLRLAYDMIITYSQMHRTDNYSQHRSIIYTVALNGWVFIYELSACGFKFRCCHLIA